MNNQYLQSTREFFLAFVCAIFFSMVIPQSIRENIEFSLINFLSVVPLTTLALLLANLSTMIVILWFGLWHKESVSFFLVLNGFALGILFKMYETNLFLFLRLLFPHSFVETSLMIIYCSQVKILSEALKTQDKKQIKRSWFIIMGVCIPLWLLAGILEGMTVTKQLN